MATSAEDREAQALDPRRFLKVIAHLGVGMSFGSGYLVADRLVLTAAHVVHAASKIGVKASGWDWAPARLVWTGTAESEPDLALLLVDMPPAPVDAVRCGRLDGRTAFGFTAVGYPLSQSRTTGAVELRDSEEVVGFLTPLTGLESGMVTLHAATTAPNPLPDGRSPWAGMSGAAVIVGGTVVGVVVHDPAAFGRDRLVAQPVTEFWDDPAAEEARAALVEVGITVATLRPGAGGRFTGAGLGADPVLTDAAAGSDLTSAGERIVGERISTAVDVFTDRVELRALLRRIVVEQEVPLVAVFGRRGIGKSGLVAKVMAELETDGAAALKGICYLSTRTGNNRLDLTRILSSAARLLSEPQRSAAHGIIESAGHSPGERCAFMLDALAGRRWVVVLDDLDSLQDAAGEITDPDLLVFLGAVARATAPPTVLLTSRRAPLLPASLLGLRMQPLEMEAGIPAADGAQLLVRLDALGQARMAELSDEDRRRLVDSVHGIPRALELLVGVRARNPLIPSAQLAAKLRATPTVLDELVSSTYRELPRLQLATVRVVAVISTPVDAESVVALCHAIDPESDDYVGALNDVVATRVLGLEKSTGKVRLHPLDAESVLDDLPTDGPWSLASLSSVVADWYRRQTLPQREWRTGADSEPALAEARHRIHAGEMRRAVQILLSLSRAWGRVTQSFTVLSLLETLKPRLQDQEDRAHHALALAYTRHRVGPTAASIQAAKEAQQAFAAMGQPLLQAEALSLEGDALRYIGHFEEAVQRGHDALALLRASVGADFDSKLDEQIGVVLLRLGLAQIYAGNPGAATVTADQLATLNSSNGEPTVQAFHADLVSLARLVDGSPAEAIMLAEEGVQFYAQSHLEPENATYVLNVAGLAYLHLRDADNASHAFSTGLDMATTLLIPRAVGFNAYNLAWALVLTGQAAQALETVNGAADAFLEDGGQEIALARSLQTCLTAVRRGDTEEALQELDAITRLSAPNPELYVPSVTALRSIAALIRAACEAASV